MTDAQHLWTIGDICAVTNGKINDRKAAIKNDGIITGISIDSREIKAGNLFVALPGTVSDGHKFLAAAQSVYCPRSIPALSLDGAVFVEISFPKNVLIVGHGKEL